MGRPTSSRRLFRRDIFMRLAIRWWSRWAPPSGSGMIVVDQAQRQQVLGGHLQGLGGLLFEGVALPEDAGAAFGADHGVVGVLEHGHAVAHADAQGPAGPPFADHHADDGRRQSRHLEHRARRSPGPGPAPRRRCRDRRRGVSIRQITGMLELGGQPHLGHRLAIAFRVGEAVVAGGPLLEPFALLVPDDHHLERVQLGPAGADRPVVAEEACRRAARRTRRTSASR